MNRRRRKSWLDYIFSKFNYRLSKKVNVPKRTYLYDFNRMKREIKPADVLLIESHTRIGNIIRLVTDSPWTHAVMYIGKLADIKDLNLREMILKHAGEFASEQLVIESIIGKGTIISPLNKYKDNHIRISRPSYLLAEDIPKIIAYTINRLGSKYSLRHVLDLGRFIFPWRIFPRRWRSSLFQHNMQQPTEDICSSMIADAFLSVDYPILPVILKNKSGYEFIPRNPRLYTPSDFDFSPFFDIIKYPFFILEKGGVSYRNLPWEPNLMSNDTEIIHIPGENKTQKPPEN